MTTGTPDFLSKLLQLRALAQGRRALAQRQYQVVRQYQQQGNRVYARSTPANVYRLALMGFDFFDARALEDARRAFELYLVDHAGLGAAEAVSEANGLEHSWEFAAYHLPGEHDQQRHAGDDGSGIDKNNDNTNYGDTLPQVVYRGGKTQETSAGWSKGVYVSTSSKAAAQWGDVVEYRVIKSPRLLDLGNWNAPGTKKIVADLTGQKPGSMSFTDYDVAAGELFIQMPDQMIDKLRRNGWNGVRLGQDAFLIGKLSNYYRPTTNKRKFASAFRPNAKFFFSSLPPTRLALDLTPGSAGLRLFDEYKRVRGYDKQLDAAANEAATSPLNVLSQPTKAQKDAGNYKKGHLKWQGFDVTIENPRGSERSGTGADGQPWRVTMSAHYGYLRRTEGADEEQVDIYLGDQPSDKVFVVDQVDADTGEFDEHKVIGDVADLGAAEALYDAGFSDGRGSQRRKAVTELTVEQFKEWLASGETDKPVARGYHLPIKAPQFFSARDRELMGSSGVYVKPEKDYAQRPLTPAERRVDFARIKRLYDEDALALGLTLRGHLKQLRDSTTELIERQANGGITADFAQSIRLDVGREFSRAVEQYLVGVWRKNRDWALEELPEAIRAKVGPRVERYHLPGQHDQQSHGGDGESTGSDKIPYVDVAPAPMASYFRYMHEQLREPELLSDRVVFVGLSYNGAMIPLGEHRRLGMLSYYAPLDKEKDIDRMARSLKEHGPDNWRAEAFKNFTVFKDAAGNWSAAWGDREKVKFLVSKFSSDEGMASLTVADHRKLGNWFGYKPDKVEQWISKNMKSKKFASAFRPDVAGDYFRNRALLVKGLVDDDLTKQVKFQIFEHLKGGRTLAETMGNLRELFEPWVGNSEKIVPSGLTGTTEDILQAYRLENIIRTEMATAISQGRAAVADAADDFVIGYELSAILDDRTTHICELADGIKFRKEDSRAIKLLPPLWYQCRTIPIFITTNDVPVEWTSEEDLDAVVREIPKGFK